MSFVILWVCLCACVPMWNEEKIKVKDVFHFHAAETAAASYTAQKAYKQKNISFLSSCCWLNLDSPLIRGWIVPKMTTMTTTPFICILIFLLILLNCSRTTTAINAELCWMQKSSLTFVVKTVWYICIEAGTGHTHYSPLIIIITWNAARRKWKHRFPADRLTDRRHRSTFRFRFSRSAHKSMRKRVRCGYLFVATN